MALGKEINMSIADISTAQSHVDAILESLLPRILIIGVSEKEVADHLETAICAEGAFELSFPSIVAFSEGAAEPHHEPQANRLLRPGDTILIDCGAKYNGWCSDVTRMFSLGEPSPLFLEKYNKVLQIHEEALQQFLPGKKVTELDQFVREQLSEDAQYFIHGLGHGVGKEVHEAPRITSIFKKTPAPKVPEILEEGMVVTCEPGLYYPNWFGIRIEDILVIRAGRPEVLSRTSRALRVLEY